MKFSQFYQQYILTESRIGDLEKFKGEALLAINKRDKINSPKFETAKELLKFMSENISHKYLQWVVDRYLDADFFLEEHKKIKDLCLAFDRCIQLIDDKEIKNYSVGEVTQIVNKHDWTTKEQNILDNREATYIKNEKDFKIIMPRTREACQVFGRGGAWCISNADNTKNLFSNYYTSANIFILIIKGSYYCLTFKKMEHIEFKNSNNKEINVKALTSKYPQLLDIFNATSTRYHYFPLLKDETIFDKENEKFIETLYSSEFVTLTKIEGSGSIIATHDFLRGSMDYDYISNHECNYVLEFKNQKYILSKDKDEFLMYKNDIRTKLNLSYVDLKDNNLIEEMSKYDNFRYITYLKPIINPEKYYSNLYVHVYSITKNDLPRISKKIESLLEESYFVVTHSENMIFSFEENHILILILSNNSRDSIVRISTNDRNELRNQIQQHPYLMEVFDDIFKKYNINWLYKDVYENLLKNNDLKQLSKEIVQINSQEGMKFYNDVKKVDTDSFVYYYVKSSSGFAIILEIMDAHVDFYMYNGEKSRRFDKSFISSMKYFRDLYMKDDGEISSQSFKILSDIGKKYGIPAFEKIPSYESYLKYYENVGDKYTIEMLSLLIPNNQEVCKFVFTQMLVKFSRIQNDTNFYLMTNYFNNPNYLVDIIKSGAKNFNPIFAIFENLASFIIHYIDSVNQKYKLGQVAEIFNDTSDEFVSYFFKLTIVPHNEYYFDEFKKMQLIDSIEKYYQNLFKRIPQNVVDRYKEV